MMWSVTTTIDLHDYTVEMLRTLLSDVRSEATIRISEIADNGIRITISEAGEDLIESAVCKSCGKLVPVDSEGRRQRHMRSGDTCPGSGRYPA